mgnify:CR=1 FL=1
MSDPFSGRSEITSDEYLAWQAQGSPTALISPAPEVEPDWVTSEKKFQERVRRFAVDHGWRVSHAYNSANSEPGVPDLKMLRCGVLRYAELKVPGGRVTKDQQWWLDELSKVPGIGVHLWYPEDWPEIERILR